MKYINMVYLVILNLSTNLFTFHNIIYILIFSNSIPVLIDRWLFAIF